jgi:hypothetical protein
VRGSFKKKYLTSESAELRAFKCGDADGLEVNVEDDYLVMMIIFMSPRRWR